MTPYFANHDRRARFPWSLYHGGLSRQLASVIRGLDHRARVLVVGCGLEPFVEGAEVAIFFGADLDDRSIATCRERYPSMKDRLAVCPGPYELPGEPPFDAPFDAVVAKEVIEHVEDPERWARALAAKVAPGGSLVLTTPNYGRFSTLPILERTVLELFARADGYSRRHLHPSRFDRARLRALALPPDFRLVAVRTTATRWALLGHWRREPAPVDR